MKQILYTGIFAFVLVLSTGCGGNNTGESSPAGSEVDHAEEARRTITEENMDLHLEELEAEIAADEDMLE